MAAGGVLRCTECASLSDRWAEGWTGFGGCTASTPPASSSSRHAEKRSDGQLGNAECFAE